MALSQSKDLTNGSVKGSIIDFAFPLFLSQLFQQLYNTADSIIVGNTCSNAAYAAVSSSGNLIFMFISFSMGVSVGAGVVISKYFGAGDYEKTSKAIHNAILLNLLLGLLLSAVGIVFSPEILRLMKTDPAVLPEAVVYFRWYFVGAPAVVMYNMFKGIMNALGDSRRPLIYLLISSVLNVILDLIFVKRYGVAAVAIATTVSQAFSSILCLIHLTKKGQIYTLSFKKLRFDRKILLDTVANGLPTGVQNSVIAFANVLVQTNINTFGENAMSACGTYGKIEGFVFLPIMSFSMALTTFISQNLGAGKKERVREGARFGITGGVILAELTGILLFIFAPYAVMLFTRDQEVISIATTQFRLETLFYLFLAYSHCVAGVCRGAGKAFVPMLVMLGVWCVIRIIYITVAMSICHDIRLLFVAYPLTWFISSIIFFFYQLNFFKRLGKAEDTVPGEIATNE